MVQNYVVVLDMVVVGTYTTGELESLVHLISTTQSLQGAELYRAPNLKRINDRQTLTEIPQQWERIDL